MTKRIKVWWEYGIDNDYEIFDVDLTGVAPEDYEEASYFAQKYIYSGQWRKKDWYDTPWGVEFKKGLIK